MITPTPPHAGWKPDLEYLDDLVDALRQITGAQYFDLRGVAVSAGTIAKEAANTLVKMFRCPAEPSLLATHSGWRPIAEAPMNVPVRVRSSKGETVAINRSSEPIWQVLVEGETAFDTGRPPPTFRICIVIQPTEWQPCDLLPAPPGTPEAEAAFQDRVWAWALECFGEVIISDTLERRDRAVEEFYEFLQWTDYPRERLHQIEAYTWGRPVGEGAQELGGMMVTIAAMAHAYGLDMASAGEVELARVWTKIDKIRAKQAAKPRGIALPIAHPTPDELQWSMGKLSGSVPTEGEGE